MFRNKLQHADNGNFLDKKRSLLPRFALPVALKNCNLNFELEGYYAYLNNPVLWLLCINRFLQHEKRLISRHTSLGIVRLSQEA